MSAQHTPTKKTAPCLMIKRSSADGRGFWWPAFHDTEDMGGDGADMLANYPKLHDEIERQIVQWEVEDHDYAYESEGRLRLMEGGEA